MTDNACRAGGAGGRVSPCRAAVGACRNPLACIGLRFPYGPVGERGFSGHARKPSCNPVA
jgi:hypothetical protein